MILDCLYHWSPADRHDSIKENGLQPGSMNTVASEPLPHLSVGTDPCRAWGLSGAVDWCADIPQWDLWYFRLDREDELTIRPFSGMVIEEVMIANPILPHRLWWVGRRSHR